MLTSLLLAAVGCTVTFCVATVLYRIHLHPLRNVPGPSSHAASRLPYIRATLTGSLPYHLHHLHQKYGPVVRTAPNEVSFIEEEACNIIYARKDAAGHPFPKNYDSWSETSNYFTHSVFIAGQSSYQRIRRALSKAFSERSLLEHESTIESNVEYFIAQLREDVSLGSSEFPSARLDLGERFQWLAFDTVSTFVFGENFNCLGSPAYRLWLHNLSQTWTFIAYISSLKQVVSIATRLLNSLGMLQSRVDILAPLDAKTDELIDVKPKKPTLLSIARSCMDDEKDKKQMPHYLSRLEVQANAAMFPVAGTDTTATVLTAVLYLLLRNQGALDHVLDEISSIKDEADITFRRVREMSYLNAAIFEAMRIYPPVPEGLPRIVPGEGQEISGYWSPPGTAVQISNYAAYRSSANFEEADSYIPERWISGSSRKLLDHGGVFRPFSTGPRHCIGQHFAMAEIRMALVKLLWHFDITLQSDEDWLDQRCFLLWQRKPLVVQLSSRGS